MNLRLILFYFLDEAGVTAIAFCRGIPVARAVYRLACCLSMSRVSGARSLVRIALILRICCRLDSMMWRLLAISSLSA